MFQIFIPSYMRHIFGGKRLYRKSTGTKDLNAAKHFRNHMLIEWKTLKEQYSPNTEERRIQNAIAGLHKQTMLRAPLQTVPTLTAIRDQYADRYRDKRSFSTLAKSARAVEVFLTSLNRVCICIYLIPHSQFSWTLVRKLLDHLQHNYSVWFPIAERSPENKIRRPKPPV